MINQGYWIDKRVAMSDLDRSGNLRVRTVVDYMQDCSVFQLNNEALLDEFFVKENAGMFLSQRQIELIRLPKYGENVRVMTWVYQLYHSMGMRNTNIYDEQGNLCVVSSAVGAFVHYDTGKLLYIPDEVMNSVPIYNRSEEMVYMPRKIAIPKLIVPTKCEDYRVREYVIDGNGHVNNAWYVDIAREALPRDWVFSHIRIEYLLPAKLDDIIYSSRYVVENGYIVVLAREDGKPYSVVEFLI